MKKQPKDDIQFLADRLKKQKKGRVKKSPPTPHFAQQVLKDHESIRQLAESHARADLADGTYPNPRPPPFIVGNVITMDVQKMLDEQRYIGIGAGRTAVITEQAYVLREVVKNFPQKNQLPLLKMIDEIVSLSNKMQSFLEDMRDER